MLCWENLFTQYVDLFAVYQSLFFFSKMKAAKIGCFAIDLLSFGGFALSFALKPFIWMVEVGSGSV